MEKAAEIISVEGMHCIMTKIWSKIWLETICYNGLLLMYKISAI